MICSVKAFKETFDKPQQSPNLYLHVEFLAELPLQGLMSRFQHLSPSSRHKPEPVLFFAVQKHTIPMKSNATDPVVEALSILIKCNDTSHLKRSTFLLLFSHHYNLNLMRGVTCSRINCTCGYFH